MTRKCPGCVGRGTGAVCCMCGGQVPARLRRSRNSPREYSPACADCRAGRPHAHRKRTR
jgi:hypothetical protein